MLLHAVPIKAGLLAASAKGPVPQPRDLGTESPDRVPVAGDGVIGEITLDNRPKPKSLKYEAVMHAMSEFCLDHPKLSGEPLLNSDPTDHELPIMVDAP